MSTQLQLPKNLCADLQRYLTENDRNKIRALLSSTHKVPEENISFLRRNGRDEIRIVAKKDSEDSGRMTAFLEWRDQYRAAGWKTQIYHDGPREEVVLYISPSKE